MNKQFLVEGLKWYALTILFAALVLIVTLWILQESPQKAYERGYEDARSVLLDTLYNRWFNDSLGWGSIDSTEKGWYGWDISEALVRSWYDRAADTSHSVYEKAAYAWAMSYLLRERKFVIYFDSTDTIPVMEMEGVEVRCEQ